MTIKVGDRVTYRPGRRIKSTYRVVITRKAYDGTFVVSMQSVRTGRLMHRWGQHLTYGGWHIEHIPRKLLLPRGA